MGVAGQTAICELKRSMKNILIGTWTKLRMICCTTLATGALFCGCKEKPLEPQMPLPPKTAAEKSKEAIKDAAAKTGDVVKDTAAKAGDAIKDTAAKGWDATKDGAGKVGDAAKDIGEDLKRGAEKLGDKFK